MFSKVAPVSENLGISLGVLSAQLKVTYMLRHDYQREKGRKYVSNLGAYNDDAVTLRMLRRASVTLDTGKLSHTLAMHYKSGYADKVRMVVEVDGGAKVPDFRRRVAAYRTLDWQTSYAAGTGLSVNAGVLNLLDRKPPFSIRDGNGEQLGYDGRCADPLGRSVYINAGITFR